MSIRTLTELEQTRDERERRAKERGVPALLALVHSLSNDIELLKRQEPQESEVGEWERRWVETQAQLAAQSERPSLDTYGDLTSSSYMYGTAVLERQVQDFLAERSKALETVISRGKLTTPDYELLAEQLASMRTFQKSFQVHVDKVKTSEPVEVNKQVEATMKKENYDLKVRFSLAKPSSLVRAASAPEGL